MRKALHLLLRAFILMKNISSSKAIAVMYVHRLKVSNEIAVSVEDKVQNHVDHIGSENNEFERKYVGFDKMPAEHYGVDDDELPEWCSS